MEPVSATAAAIMGGSQIASGLISALGQHSANHTAIHIARKQREWQERMSNTAHQREVADLQAAGLNPLLSAGAKGASSGSSPIASVGNVGDAFAKHIDPSAILDLQQARANIGKTRAEQAAIEAQTENTKANNALIEAQTAVAQWNAAKIEAEISGSTVEEAGIKLYGLEWKWSRKSYNNQPTPTTAAAENIVDPLVRAKNSGEIGRQISTLWTGGR